MRRWSVAACGGVVALPATLSVLWRKYILAFLIADKLSKQGFGSDSIGCIVNKHVADQFAKTGHLELWHLKVPLGQLGEVAPKFFAANLDRAERSLWGIWILWGWLIEGKALWRGRDGTSSARSHVLDDNVETVNVTTKLSTFKWFSSTPLNYM